jgi:3-hydroxyacyl-CoA dehydrogenase
MKIAIVGAGAMGSLFGALLAEGGHEVWLCDIWQEARGENPQRQAECRQQPAPNRGIRAGFDFCKINSNQISG